MKIDLYKNGGEFKIALDGRLDTNTAPDFEDFLNEKCADASSLVIDCENLVYISSAGLRVLLFAQKKTGGAMKLVNVDELIMEVLEMTGFADIMVIE